LLERLVLRALRPYTARHDELDRAVADALAEGERRQAELELILERIDGERSTRG
jgi:hypothetical protein